MKSAFLAVPSPFADPDALFITGTYHSGFYPDSSWSNDAEQGNRSLRQDFLKAATGLDTIGNLQKALNESVLRDNPFTGLRSVEDVLKTRVYRVEQPPRLIRLPQQRDVLMTLTFHKDPAVFTKLCEDFIHSFLGGGFGSGHDGYIGYDYGGRASLDTAKKYLPVFSEKLTRYLEAKAASGVIQKGPGNSWYYGNNENIQADIQKLFYESITPLDAGALRAAYDYEGSEATTARFLKDRWDMYASHFEGIAFTDISLGQETKRWPALHLKAEFVKANTRFIGTTEDLLRQGHLAWPEKKRFEWKPFWYRRCAEDPQGFKAGVQAIKDRVYAQPV